jgi:hypothetical protein
MGIRVAYFTRCDRAQSKLAGFEQSEVSLLSQTADIIVAMIRSVELELVVQQPITYFTLCHSLR